MMQLQLKEEIIHFRKIGIQASFRAKSVKTGKNTSGHWLYVTLNRLILNHTLDSLGRCLITGVVDKQTNFHLQSIQLPL